MNFANNVQALRKQKKMTQEELAEAVGVSRQAVSKWESGQSTPELEKLLQLATLFHCSVDTLLTEEILQGEAAIAETEKEKAIFTEYDQLQTRSTYATTIGVTLILLGVTILIYFSENSFAKMLFPLILFLGLISISVFLFIYYGNQISAFKREYFTEETFELKDFYDPDEKKKAYKTHGLVISIGVLLIFIGLIVLLLSQYVFTAETTTLPITLFMLFVTVSVALFVYQGCTREKYELEQFNKKARGEQLLKEESLADRISGAIMMLATAVFLILGFLFGLWHPGWVVFPIGGILCGVASTLIGK